MGIIQLIGLGLALIKLVKEIAALIKFFRAKGVHANVLQSMVGDLNTAISSYRQTGDASELNRMRSHLETLKRQCEGTGCPTGIQH